MECHCHGCGLDFRQAKTISIENDALGRFSQLIIQSWLMNGAAPNFECDLPNAAPQILLRVVEGLVHSTRLAGMRWTYLHDVVVKPELLFSKSRTKLTPGQSYCLYTTAIKTLLNWPENFYKFLDVWRSRPGHNQSAILTDDFGWLFKDWIQVFWQFPPFDFVQVAFDDYVINKYPPSLSVLNCYGEGLKSRGVALPYCGIREAFKILEVKGIRFEELIRGGYLKVYSVQHIKNQEIRFFLKRDLLALRARLDKGLSMYEAMALLGAPRNLVADLVRVGLLKAMLNPQAKDTANWLFERKAIQTCLKELNKHVKESIVSNTQLIQMTTACRQSTTSVIEMVMGICAGKLNAYYGSKNTDKAFNNVYVGLYELKVFADAQKASASLICREAAAKRLKVKTKTLDKWVKTGLIQYVQVRGRRKYLSRVDVDNFWSRYIRCKDVVLIFNITYDALLAGIRRKLLTPATTYVTSGYRRIIFERALVEQELAWFDLPTLPG